MSHFEHRLEHISVKLMENKFQNKQQQAFFEKRGA